MRDRQNSHKPSRLSLEHLEQRVLLYAGHGLDSTLTDKLGVSPNAPMEQLAPIPALSESAAYDSLGSLKLEKGLGGSRGQRPGGGLEYPDFFPSIGDLSLDQTSQQGRTLVRFSTWVNNQGNGPAVLRSGEIDDPLPTDKPIIFDDPNGPQQIDGWINDDGSRNVLQEVYSWNGSSYSKDHYRLAGRVTYHGGHGHFHFDGYAGYALRHKNPDGSVGDYVQRPDGTGAVGAKVGFCLINSSGSFTMEDGSSSTTLPGYRDPGQPSTDCSLLQGIHVGFADIYSSFISGQWLDVTDVPNGDYFIEIDLDSEDVVKESNESNNAKTFAYTLNANPTSGGIDPDQYDDNNENNNSFENATDMGVLGTFTQTGLTVHWGLDFDYFKFEASSSGNYSVSSTGNGDINLYLFDSSFTLLDTSTNFFSASETVSHNFVKGETYYVRAQTYNSSTSSNYQLAWNLKPEASSLTSAPFASENGQIGKFVIARNGPVNTPLTVDFTLSGDAVNGVDYELVSNSVTIGNLASEAEIEIVALPNAAIEDPQSVILTITSDNAYVTGATGSQLTIFDVTPDFDLNGSLGLPDIDMLTQNIAGGATESTYDLNGDNLVNTDDLDEWLAIAGATNLPSSNAYLRGDANLDGFVDGTDFSIWKNNRFTANTAWSAGNFNADTFIDGIDLLLWNANKSLAPPPMPAVPIVDLMAKQRESTTLRSRHDATDLALQEVDEKEWLLLPIVQR